MKHTNQIMLITYADSLGSDLKQLNFALKKYFSKAIKGIHILPFYPSSADRGFAPLTYKTVDRKFGNWSDINELAKDYYLMFDFMANHISRSSEYFLDFRKKKDLSKYKDLFITYKEFWENGYPTNDQIDLIYKRKPRAPYIDIKFDDGSKEKVWCTFNEEQIDINIQNTITKEFIKDNLDFLCENHVSIIRLDAFAYITKKENTNCFFVEPEIWDYLNLFRDMVKPNNVVILPEIHEHYSMQLKLAEKDYYVYDFSLPMLLLNAIYSGRKDNLENWLKICPRKQFTTLDTHDGIGIVDVVDLMSQEDINFTRENMYTNGVNVKKVYNTEKYNNLDIYQINCTYYSALGNDDDSYILARAIQFFVPGIPQVYYVGLLAGENDIKLLEETKEGRNINRHYYSLDEIDAEVKRSVVKELIRLMEFRNQYKAFDGDFEIVENNNPELLVLKWTNNALCVVLEADLLYKKFTIKYFDTEKEEYCMW